MHTNDTIVVGLDFDGTVVYHRYPQLGDWLPGAQEALLQIQRDGHKIVLNTMRSGVELAQAVQLLHSIGIELYGINTNPTQSSWTSSPKVLADLYIDDCGYGMPLIHPEQDRPYVDWSKIDIDSFRHL